MQAAIVITISKADDTQCWVISRVTASHNRGKPQIKIMNIKLKESVFHMGVDEVS